MIHTPTLTPQLLELLRTADTCTISNAIETLELRMKDEGYIQTQLQCLLPDLPPVAGCAVTGRIRTSAPPVAHVCYYHRTDWWRYLAGVAGPKIMVIADVDRAPGTAAFLGEIHAEIAAALGCVAYVSNGAVRDVPALERMRFQCLAGGVTVSHAYAHLIEWNEPVEIGCLKIRPGDVLQVDRHGVLSVPSAALAHLEERVAEIRKREAELIRLCHAPDFSIKRLLAAIGTDAQC